MAEAAIEGPRLDPVGRALAPVTRWLAVAGGVILCAVGLLTVVSVLGRFLFNLPVTGDFELVEMGCAYAVSLFLPYCQFVKRNVVVDFFTAAAPAPVRYGLDALGGLVYAALAALLTWRSWVGAANLRATGDVTTILGLPVGWIVLVTAFSLALVVIVAGYTVWRDFAVANGRADNAGARP